MGQHFDKVEALLSAHRITWDDGYGDQFDDPDSAAVFYVCSQSPRAGTVLHLRPGSAATVRFTIVGQDVNCDGSLKSDSGAGGSSGGTSGGSTPDGASGGDGSTTNSRYPVLLSPSGHYYRAGEFCPHADDGTTTVNSAGTSITCSEVNGYYRWHY